MKGYLTLALDKQKYVDMAINLSLSIKRVDQSPVCLLINDKVKLPTKYESLFDYVITIPQNEDTSGCANKIFMFQHSPFEKTLFVDADCLMIGNDISFFWEVLEKYHFTVVGQKAKSGAWGRYMNISQICQKFDLPYVVRMNSGVIYFDKSPIAQKVASKLEAYYHNSRKEMTSHHRDVPGEYADEPLIGAAMGYYQLEPLPEVIEGKSLMMATYKGSHFNIDISEEKCNFQKGGKVYSPTICHFGGVLYPYNIYKKQILTLNGVLDNLHPPIPQEDWPLFLPEKSSLPEQIKQFLEIYKETPIKGEKQKVVISPVNLFAMWILLKNLKPDFIVQSGVSRGQTTWMIEQTLAQSELICLSSNENLFYKSSQATYIDEDFLLCSVSNNYEEKGLLILDDHKSVFERIIIARAKGFRHVITNDNYPLGQGDYQSFSRSMVKGGRTVKFLQEAIEYSFTFPPIYRSEEIDEAPDPIFKVKNEEFDLFWQQRNRYRWLTYLRLKP